MVGNAIAQSAQPIISYNFGLGEKKRVADTKRIALFTSVICGIVTTAAFILFPHILVGLFVNPDNTAALIAIEGFPYFSLAFVFFIINLMLIGYYQSVKNVKLANLFALLPEAMGTNGAWLALCLSEMLTTLTVAILFILRKKNTPASNKVKNAVKRFFSGMPRHAHKIPASEYR